MIKETILYGHPLLPEGYLQLHSRMRKPIYFISCFSDILYYTTLTHSTATPTSEDSFTYTINPLLASSPSTSTSLSSSSSSSSECLNIFQFGLRRNGIQKGVNYDPHFATKRPKNWDLIRSYRMKRREQLLVLSGVTEEVIEETKFSRYKQVR